MFTSGSFKNEVAVVEEGPRNTVDQLESTVVLLPRWDNVFQFKKRGTFEDYFLRHKTLLK